MKTFVQSPEVYLNQLEITLTDYLDSTRVASLDTSHRSLVNLEAFFFANSKSKKRFDDNLLQYCKRLTDPVTHQQFRPGALSPKTTFKNRVMFFVSDSTMNEFVASPENYWPPDYRMRPQEMGTGGG